MIKFQIVNSIVILGLAHESMSENHINCMKKLDDETFEYSDQGSKSRDIVDYVGKIQKVAGL